jgi:hypothetical protein
MPVTQPLLCVEYTERDLSRYQDDLRLFTCDFDISAKNNWILEDLIAKANFLFERVMVADVRFQQHVLVAGADEDPLQGKKLREMLGTWLEISLDVAAQAARFDRDRSRVEGIESLNANLREAKSILTPDEEYFDVDKMSVLRDQAIDEHRMGMTEPLLENERSR